MRKSLLTLSLALMLGGAAVAVAATQGETAPQPAMPMLLAQASPQPFNRPAPPPEGRGTRRAPLSAEQIASRRQAACEDRADRMAGQLAYLEARLDLTAAQRTSFERWRDIRQAAAQRQARTCASQPAGRGAANEAGTNSRPSPVDRMAREEEQLRTRLADLTAERPALEALYNSLTPEQRQKFTPAGGALGMGGPGMGRGGRGPRMAMMMRGAGGGMMRGPNGRGPGGRGPGGRGPGMAPPPGAPGAPPPVQ